MEIRDQFYGNSCKENENSLNMYHDMEQQSTIFAAFTKSLI